MNNKNKSVPFISFICVLLLLGITSIGYGLGKLANRECEGIIIAVGIGLITIAMFLKKIIVDNDDYH
jgi:hypothetical protein